MGDGSAYFHSSHDSLRSKAYVIDWLAGKERPGECLHECSARLRTAVQWIEKGEEKKAARPNGRAAEAELAFGLLLEDEGVRGSEQLSQHQEVVSTKRLRRSPGVSFLIGTADGHVVERTFVGVVLPDCSLDTSSSESLDGLWFVCHDSFSFKVKLIFGPAPQAEDQVNETKGNDDLKEPP